MSREMPVNRSAVSASPAYVMKSSRADHLEPEVRAIIREVIPTSPMYRIFTMKRLAASWSCTLRCMSHWLIIVIPGNSNRCRPDVR